MDGNHFGPPGGHVRGFIQPWLLLLLSQEPSHGYELLERLEQGHSMPAVDPGFLYRTLRQFEEEGLVRSTWDTSGSGPAKRVYEISEEGIEYLHAWAINIRRVRSRLSHFLEQYRERFGIS